MSVASSSHFQPCCLTVVLLFPITGLYLRLVAVAGQFLRQGSCSGPLILGPQLGHAIQAGLPRDGVSPSGLKWSWQSLMLMRGNSSWRGGQLELSLWGLASNFFFFGEQMPLLFCFSRASAITAHSFWQSELVISNCGFNKSFLYNFFLLSLPPSVHFCPSFDRQ